MLTPRPEHAAARALLAAEGAFIDLADLHYADAILVRAVERAAAGPERAEAMSLQALVWYFQGRQAEATRLCEEALAESGGESGVRAKILLRCAYLHGQVDMARSLREVEEAVGILEHQVDVDPDLMAEALLDRASGALQMVPGLAPTTSSGAPGCTPERSSWEWDRCEVILYELARHTDDLETALRASPPYRASGRPRRRGSVSLRPRRANQRWLGDWSRARAWAERAIETYRREGVDLYRAFALRGSRWSTRSREEWTRLANCRCEGWGSRTRPAISSSRICTATSRIRGALVGDSRGRPTAASRGGAR